MKPLEKDVCRTKKHSNNMRPAPSAAHGVMSVFPVSVAFVVHGQCASLKNRRRLLRNKATGKAFFARAKAAISFMDAFQAQVPAKYRNLKLGALDRPLRLIATVFYQSRRSDLDISAVMDGLQKAGVIANDRFLVEQHLYAEIDKLNPRVEIQVEEI